MLLPMIAVLISTRLRAHLERNVPVSASQLAADRPFVAGFASTPLHRDFLPFQRKCGTRISESEESIDIRRASEWERLLIRISRR